MNIEQLQARVNHNERLVHRGRFVNTRFLLGVGTEDYLVDIAQGRIGSISPGPFVMPRWHFALRADEADWLAFWQDEPAPGYQDLMALVKHRKLKVEGDQHPFMANLFYFKAVLESMRNVAPISNGSV
jgi:hypothetical protein